MTRVLLLCGSQRRQSLNAHLLDELARHLPAHVKADRVQPSEIDLPLFDQDIEGDPSVRSRVAALHARFSAADAIILACPEYNGLMTPYLKNIVDWVSRLPHVDATYGNAFLDRPVLLCSATPGWSGGGLAIVALRTLFGHVGAIPFGETICLPYAAQAWDEAGRLDPVLPDFGWQACVSRFCAFVARIPQGESL